MIRSDTMKNWQEKLLRDGYAPGSVNAFLSAANSYLDYIGHREYQLAGKIKEKKVPQPELSRAEYLHLLHTVKMLGNVNSFVCRGITIRAFAGFSFSRLLWDGAAAGTRCC